MSDVVRKCYECGAQMKLVLERPDPHEPAVRLWVCNNCGNHEEPGLDIEAHNEGRPRLPGL